MTTIQQLAAKSGVSVATVSRALNGSPEVSESTRKRILALAQQLDYTPSAAARTLVSRRSHVVGVILDTGPGHPDLLHPFFQEVLVGLKHGAGARGYDLLLFASDEPGNGFGGTHSYLRRAGHHGVDGAVVLGFDGRDPQIARLAASNLPCIVVDADLGGPRTGFVMSENEDGARLAVRHLHGLGHERIATITGTLGTAPGDDRLEGYRSELAALGLALRDEYVVEGDFYDESGYRGTRRLLELDEPPTAIFAASDLMAAGALRAANELGVGVPADVAVVGFDDIGLASLIQPQLTTVRQDMHALGEAAAVGLARMIEDPEAAPARELVPTRLVVRASSGGQRAPRERTLTSKEVG
ncbi:MAG TPA: LacI family DNA-binding transcriptional regulator [Gaiellaceae bacterium]|nr:LacI family DNA-binding transcriptional regulator [Gaiellaceae bacterium]